MIDLLIALMEKNREHTRIDWQCRQRCGKSTNRRRMLKINTNRNKVSSSIDSSTYWTLLRKELVRLKINQQKLHNLKLEENKIKRNTKCWRGFTIARMFFHCWRKCWMLQTLEENLVFSYKSRRSISRLSSIHTPRFLSI